MDLIIHSVPVGGGRTRRRSSREARRACRSSLGGLVARSSASKQLVARLGRRSELGSLVARRSARSSLVARPRSQSSLGLRSSLLPRSPRSSLLPRLAPRSSLASLLAPSSPRSSLLARLAPRSSAASLLAPRAPSFSLLARLARIIFVKGGGSGEGRAGLELEPAELPASGASSGLSTSQPLPAFPVSRASYFGFPMAIELLGFKEAQDSREGRGGQLFKVESNFAKLKVTLKSYFP